MNKQDKLTKEFINHGGVITTSELNDIGFSSRQINTLLEEDKILRLKRGFYESIEYPPKDEVVIARLFPEAVIFLESAMQYYGYSDRIPAAWQIAVDRKSNVSQYDISYPLIKPFYIEAKLLNLGVDMFNEDGVEIRVYDRDRTICDVLRYESKLENEVFTTAIKRDLEDPDKNIRKLFEYADVFNISNKVQTYLGVWL